MTALNKKVWSDKKETIGNFKINYRKEACTFDPHI